MNLYAGAMPNLMRTVDNAVFLGNTLVANSSNLDALLVNATGMANTANGVVEPKKAQIIAMLNDSNPTMSLIEYQSPGIACFIRTVAIGGKMASPVFGTNDGLLKLNAGLLPGKDPYTYPRICHGSAPTVHRLARTACPTRGPRPRRSSTW